MAKKVFTSRVNSQRETLSDFEIFGETFYIKPVLPTDFYLDLMTTLAELQESKNTSLFVKELKPFFNMALVPESAARFLEILKSEDKVIDLQTLVEIFDYIISETANRPTDGSSN